MIKMLSGKLAESVFSFAQSKGEDKANSFIANKLDQQELEKAIQEYLDVFGKKNLPDLSLDEEFDFKKFSDFLFSKQDRLEEYFYSQIGERDIVLEILQGEALAYAKPKGQSGRRMVLGCLDAVLAVIENVLMQRVETKDLFLASRTADQIHQSVKQLMEEHTEQLHRHIDYRGSFAERVDNVEMELPEDDRAYHYRNAKIGFFGREEELEYLDAFLDDEARLLYTVITGPGGIGKSKLLYQYVHMNGNDPAWKMLYPS